MMIIRKSRDVWPLHPFLFALGYVSTEFSLHADIYKASEVWPPILVSIGMAGVIFLIVRFWNTDLYAAGVWASAWVVILYFVGSWASRSPSAPHMVLLGVLTCGIFVLARRLARFQAQATKNLNTGVIIFLTVQCFFVVNDRYFSPGLPIAEAASSFPMTTPRTTRTIIPNIFHTVMDAYSRDDVLRSVYGHDNNGFSRDLKELGFHVFEDAHVPYNQTLLTMASVFSGTYLDQEMLRDRYRDATQLRQSLGRFLDDGAVSVWLRELGYRISAASTGVALFRFNNVDRWEHPVSEEMNLFAFALYDKSLFGWIDRRLLNGAVQHWLFKYSRSDRYLNEIVRQVLPLGAPQDWDAPYLIYRHILAPHPPFTLDDSGQDIRSEKFSTISDGEYAHRNFPQLREAYIKGYVQKLKFANRELLVGLNRILNEAPRPFVILVHSDHGGGAYLTQESAEHTCIKERFSAMMAVYASDKGHHRNLVSWLQQSPTPVNFYRALYNTMHQASLPMLQDESQFATWSEPWSLIPVSSEAREKECTKR